ncbi:MAG: hypothetical protein WDO24_16210 [Pseudomonadota bacterium]
MPGVAPEPRFAAHLDYAARHQPPIEAALPPPANDRDPDRPLRIGLLSSDLRNHPVGHLLRPWFRWCDRTTHQLICYAEVAAPDRQSELFRAAADGWRSTVGLADRAVAEMIRNDRIDLLIVSPRASIGTARWSLATGPPPFRSRCSTARPPACAGSTIGSPTRC